MSTLGGIYVNMQTAMKEPAQLSGGAPDREASSLVAMLSRKLAPAPAPLEAGRVTPLDSPNLEAWENVDPPSPLFLDSDWVSLRDSPNLLGSPRSPHSPSLSTASSPSADALLGQPL